MANTKQIVRLLEEQRRTLVEHLEAMDRTIAALGKGAAETPRSQADLPVNTPRAALPRKVKARRVLTDSHKEALNAGRRKARQTRDVGKGLAREMPDDGFVPAIGTRSNPQAPRLVKRPTSK